MKVYLLANNFYKRASEEDLSNYPDDYAPGKKYGREVLAKIFANLTGFPYLACKEAFFPLLPGGVDLERDPGAMQIYGPEEITIEEFAAKEKLKYRGWEIGIFPLSMDLLSDETKDFIQHKKEAPGYGKRVAFQKAKALKGGSLSITPASEPIVMIEKDGKYSLREGWHRALALLDLLDSGELGVDSAPIRAIVGRLV